MTREEYPDGSLVLATYRGYWSGQPGDPRGEDFEKVWTRADRNPAQDSGDWWEVLSPRAWCPGCGASRHLGPAGPSSWGEVCGLDDPEPYGIDQVRLYTADEVEAMLAEARSAVPAGFTAKGDEWRARRETTDACEYDWAARMVRDGEV